MNVKNSLLLADPDFDPNAAGEFHLLIKLTTDSLSYAIIDKGSNALKAVYDCQECPDSVAELAEKLQRDGYLLLDFKTVKVSAHTENSIAVPDELFQAAQPEDFASYFALQLSDKLHVHPVTRHGFTAVFNFSDALEDTLDRLPGCRRFDQNAPLLALSADASSGALSLDFTAGSVNVSFVRGEGLVLSRYFEIDNAEELNYYLLLMISQLDISPEHTAVQLSGIIHEGDSNYRCIGKYFKDIAFRDAGTGELDSRILGDMPAHYYSSLLALDLCE